jgi:hypothetical protein
VFTNSLIHQEAALTQLLAGGIGLADRGTEFLSSNQQRLVRWIRGIGGFVDVLYDNRRAGITDAMTVNLALGHNLPNIVKQGFLHSDALFATDLPAYYGGGDRPSYRTSFGSMVGGDQ